MPGPGPDPDPDEHLGLEVSESFDIGTESRDLERSH